MIHLSENPLITVVPKILENALSDPAKEVGKMLSNVFYVVFSPINFPADKYRLKQSKNLEAYAKSLEEEINKVPSENLVEPPLNIVGPALEASKYYIDEDYLRKMFSKIIASSMDIKKVGQVHPSFIEIIKQLDGLDASNMKLIGYRQSLPIVRYQVIFEDQSVVNHLENVFIENSSYDNLKTSSSSISNLERLGLISIDYDSALSNDSLYDLFYKTQVYTDLIESLKDEESRYAGLEKGLVRITPLGENFLEVCVN